MSDGTAAYLHRLGFTDRPDATIESLREIHRRHQRTIPYENLGIMLGPVPSVDPETSVARVREVGRAGYCLHQNAVLEIVLRDLGFDVERRHGHEWSDPELSASDALNHLVLVVSGLPTPDNPRGRWWPDVGLGEGFLDVLPLVPGTYLDGPFKFEITEVGEDGWSFRNDPTGSFVGLEVTTRPSDQASVEAAHAVLSTPPDGEFARVMVVQRRDEAGLDTVRGCMRVRVDAAGKHEVELTTYAAWRAALVDIGVSLEGITEEALQNLWQRSLVAHKDWLARRRS